MISKGCSLFGSSTVRYPIIQFLVVGAIGSLIIRSLETIVFAGRYIRNVRKDSAVGW